MNRTAREAMIEARAFCEEMEGARHSFICKVDDHILMVLFARDSGKADCMHRAFFTNDEQEAQAIDECLMMLKKRLMM